MPGLQRLEAAGKTTHGVTTSGVLLTTDHHPAGLGPGGAGAGELDKGPGLDVVSDPLVNVDIMLCGPPPHFPLES